MYIFLSTFLGGLNNNEASISPISSIINGAKLASILRHIATHNDLEVRVL